MSEEHETEKAEKTKPETELQTSIRQTLEEWWNAHIHQSSLVKDPKGWNHLVTSFEKLKEMIRGRFH